MYHIENALVMHIFKRYPIAGCTKFAGQDFAWVKMQSTYVRSQLGSPALYSMLLLLLHSKFANELSGSTKTICDDELFGSTKTICANYPKTICANELFGSTKTICANELKNHLY